MFNEAKWTRAKKKLKQHFLDETATRLQLLANRWEAKWSFIGENREKPEEPSWYTSDNGGAALQGISMIL